MKLYIAYGSNLNTAQMKYRCPTAKLAGIGSLKNCELDFRRLSSQAYATIHPRDGSHVPVAFWEIDQTAEDALDVYEGFPGFYYKQIIPLDQADGQKCEAMVYVMNDDAVPGIPSRHYVRTIYQGYKDVGLNTEEFEKICLDCGFSLYSMLNQKGVR